jgi:hypothetical protein
VTTSLEPQFDDSQEGLEALQFHRVVEARGSNGIKLQSHLRFLTRDSPISSVENSFTTTPIANPPYTSNQYKTVEILHRNNLADMVGSFKPHNFTRMAVNHPNQPHVIALADGFLNGFPSNIREMTEKNIRYGNHSSAFNHIDTIEKSQIKELKAGRTSHISQDILDQLPYSCNNPLGVVVKGGKERVIVDKSFGEGDAVNARIYAKDYGTIIMDSVQMICDIIRKLRERGVDFVFMLEDVTAYFRNLPVQVRDRPMQLIIHPNGDVEIDHCENFGDRSVPFKSGFLGDVICWVMKEPPVDLEAYHFSDNFYGISIVDKKDPGKQRRDRAKFRGVFEELGLPLNAKDSIMGTRFKLLGFDWDVEAFSVSVPRVKRIEIVDELINLLGRGHIEWKCLERMTGVLVWVSQIIKSANCFASILWKVLYRYKKINEKRSWKERTYFKVMYEKEPLLREALVWFKKTLMVWSGTSYLRHFDWLVPQLGGVLGCASDASKIGGSFTTPTHYGWWVWCPCCVEKAKGDMTLLELGAILIGFSTSIGAQLATQRVIWLTDNLAGSWDYSNGYAKNCPVRSQIVAELHAVAIKSNIDLLIEWVPREYLKRTDILTRGGDTEFLAMKGEKRSYAAPYSGESVFVFDHQAEKQMVGFSHFHPEIVR